MNGDRNPPDLDGAEGVAEALRHLRSLQDALENGTAHVRIGDGFGAMTPNEAIKMEVERWATTGRQSVRVTLRWERPGPEGPRPHDSRASGRDPV